MIDKIYFIYSAIFSFSGFAIGFYGTMAQYKIEKIITNAKNLGFDSDSDLWSEKAQEYGFKISVECEKWLADGIINKGDDIADYYLNSYSPEILSTV